MIPQKKRLLGLTPTKLKAVVGSLGMPAFTARQIAQWLYEKHVKSIDEMTNISKQNRERLNTEYEVGALAPIDCQRSKDGTIKYLFPVVTANTHHPSPNYSSKPSSSLIKIAPHYVYHVRLVAR